MDYPSISTHLLVPLLCRWAFCNRGAGGFGADGERRNSKDLLLALLGVISEGQHQILIAPSTCWAPPLAPHSASQLGGYAILEPGLYGGALQFDPVVRSLPMDFEAIWPSMANVIAILPGSNEARLEILLKLLVQGGQARMDTPCHVRS